MVTCQIAQTSAPSHQARLYVTITHMKKINMQSVRLDEPF